MSTLIEKMTAGGGGESAGMSKMAPNYTDYPLAGGDDYEDRLTI
jgi:hypothetical protein